jgi:hypothetical protein
MAWRKKSWRPRLVAKTGNRENNQCGERNDNGNISAASQSASASIEDNEKRRSTAAKKRKKKHRRRLYRAHLSVSAAIIFSGWHGENENIENRNEMKAKSMRKWRPARNGLAYRRRHLGEAVNQWRNVAAKMAKKAMA